MSAALKAVARSATTGQFFASELASAVRALLDAPLGSGDHLVAVTRAKAILQCYDDERAQDSAREVAAAMGLQA